MAITTPAGEELAGVFDSLRGVAAGCKREREFLLLVVSRLDVSHNKRERELVLLVVSRLDVKVSGNFCFLCCRGRM